MVRTKFWAGFLDYLGVANFVGPDESINKMGEEAFNSAMNDYVKTPEAQQNWQSDFQGEETESNQQTQTPKQSEQQKTKSMTQDFLSDMLFGPLEPLVP
jgi:hypothetical protein